MVHEGIIQHLDTEIARLVKVKELLTEQPPKKPAGRTVSPEGRKAMAEAQKRRWAKAKRSA